MIAVAVLMLETVPESFSGQERSFSSGHHFITPSGGAAEIIGTELLDETNLPDETFQTSIDLTWGACAITPSGCRLSSVTPAARPFYLLQRATYFIRAP